MLALGLASAKTPSAVLARAAVKRMDVVVRRADRRLTTWRRKLERARRQRAFDLRVLTRYAGQVRAELSTYSGLRTDMQRWIDKVNSDGATFDEAYSFLGDAYTGREAVRAALAGLSPPPAVSSAHDQLVAVVAESVDAIDSATSGIADYQFSTNHASYDQTEGWRAFQDASDRISREYGTAIASWEAKVSQRERQIKQRSMPTQPAV